MFIILGEVISTEVKTYYIDEQKNTGEFLIETITIHECLKGDYQTGDEIVVGEDGNGTTIINNNIIKSGGYLEKGDKVVLFLERDQDNLEWFKKMYENEVMPYGKSSLQGRIWLDDNYEIDQTKNDYEYALFKDCEAINKLKSQIEEIINTQNS